MNHVRVHLEWQLSHHLNYLTLNPFCLASHKRDIGKECKHIITVVQLALADGILLSGWISWYHRSTREASSVSRWYQLIHENWTTPDQVTITKTHLYNFDPLKPHFYIVKLGFTGVHVYIIFFLFLLKITDCRYSLEPPRRGGSNEYPQFMFLSRNMKKYKNIRIFYLKIFIF